MPKEIMGKNIGGFGLAGILLTATLLFKGCIDEEDSLFKKVSIIADKKGDKNCITDIGEMTSVYMELNLDYNTMNPQDLSIKKMREYITKNTNYLHE